MLKKSLLSVLTVGFIAGIFAGCSIKAEKRLVIWTDNSEFASYLEIYNECHKNKAVLVYKENIAASLPPARDELQPDIVAGTWLRNSRIKKNFKPINFLFERKYLSSSDFYPVLLNIGKQNHKQYLLPANFNLSAIIFSEKNIEKTENSYTISLDQLRKAGAEFNRKNKKGAYTAIGFAPQSSKDFMYTVAKMKDADFHEEKNGSFQWNQENLLKTISFLNQWITNENTSPQIENDFVYKYLSVSDAKRVTSERTLFAYTTSDKLFQLTNEDLSKIDFRWLEYNGQIPVEDKIMTMGISTHAENQADAAEFISWFFKTETQKQFLERKINSKLDNSLFGIAGGFSTIKDVNQQILPVHYTKLLSNIPQAGTFFVPSSKPYNWERIKSRVILPYIEESVYAAPGKKVSTIEERYSDLKKLGY